MGKPSIGILLGISLIHLLAAMCFCDSITDGFVSWAYWESMILPVAIGYVVSAVNETKGVLAGVGTAMLLYAIAYVVGAQYTLVPIWSLLMIALVVMGISSVTKDH
ncbi:MAG: hypothetical protein Q4B68_07595 [Bacteroidales bacterium]|nr:hypothetical protein [Bacteroidales bacterium]